MSLFSHCMGAQLKNVAIYLRVMFVLLEIIHTFMYVRVAIATHSNI